MIKYYNKYNAEKKITINSYKHIQVLIQPDSI